MAQHASALKQMRQSRKRRARNRKDLTHVKGQVKKLRAAIAPIPGLIRQALAAKGA